MYEYVIFETQEHVGFAWAQGNCYLVRMGHKHAPHIDGTRACPGYLPVQLMAFPADKPAELVFNREMERIEPDPTPEDPDDIIRRLFSSCTRSLEGL
jgi:hypothetical protein